MNKTLSFLIKAIFFFLILAGIVISCLYIVFSPKLSGVLEHNHQKYGNIQIRRDDHGIPHIQAKDYDSACYGQGFATAQDRLFNMYVKRSLIQGRLSELDSKGFNTDIFFRTIGINRIAEKTMKTISKEGMDCLQAYSDGVNDYYHSLSIKPLEFILTQAVWRDWTPYDSICYIKFMYFLLSMDYMFEPLRSQLAEQFGAEDSLFMSGVHHEKQQYQVTVMNDDELKQSGIYEQYQRNRTVDLNKEVKFSEETKQKLMNTTLSNILYDLYSTSYGSNSWVIHGNYTESGKPILSNDPHLQNSIPCTWYQTEILMTEQNKTVHGASMPGIPLIMIGRTDFASWGITVLYADNTDLYVEKVEGNKYLLDGEWKDLKIVKEIINVKGGNPYELEVKYTHRGPLIDYTTDFHFENPFLKHGLVTSLAFAASFEFDNTFDAFKTIINAQSTKEIRDSFASLSGPALSLLYCTESGDIGYYGISRIPYTNYPEMGPFLKDGTTSKYDWAGITNRDENPQIINPKKGYIVAANNKFATNNLKHHYSISISCTPRASRIDELIQQQLKSGKKFNIEDMKRIMFDTLDIYARDVVPSLNLLFEKYGEKVLNNDKILIQQAKHTLKQIQNWDYRFDASSKQAPYFAAWEFLYSDKSMHSFNTSAENRNILTKGRQFWHFQFSKIYDWSSGVNTNYDELWCHNAKNNKTGHACLYNVFMALAETQQLLDQKYTESGNPNRTWGNLHVNNFAHFPFSKTILKKIYHRSFPGFGNARTVAVAIPNYLYDSFHANQGANFRAIFDMSNPHEKNYYLVDTGSSENVFSPYYDDQLKMHEEFVFIEMKSGFKNFMQNQKHVFDLVYKNQNNKKNNQEL
ncbi:hypothetical protein ABPG74_011736 [Tetrahymena malaccensis]